MLPLPESNRLQPACNAGTLPHEIRGNVKSQYNVISCGEWGIRTLTFCLQSKRPTIGITPNYVRNPGLEPGRQRYKLHVRTCGRAFFWAGTVSRTLFSRLEVWHITTYASPAYVLHDGYDPSLPGWKPDVLTSRRMEHSSSSSILFFMLVIVGLNHGPLHYQCSALTSWANYQFNSELF